MEINGEKNCKVWQIGIFFETVVWRVKIWIRKLHILSFIVQTIETKENSNFHRHLAADDLRMNNSVRSISLSFTPITVISPETMFSAKTNEASLSSKLLLIKTLYAKCEVKRFSWKSSPSVIAKIRSFSPSAVRAINQNWRAPETPADGPAN